jgi:hypothetical protein
VAVIDADGQLVTKRRIADDAAGFSELLAVLETAGESADDPIPVAIETSRGLLVAALRAPTDRCTRSTRWRWPDTVNGTRWRARNPTTSTP